MNTQTLSGTYENISQRVVISHLRLLADLPEGAEPAGRDLHDFFQASYESMLREPALFGLPLDEDISLPQERPEGSIDLQEANRRLAKPRGQMELGLNFLMAAAQAATLDGSSLVLSPQAFKDSMTKPKAVRKFIQGLLTTGLEIDEGREQVVVRSRRFPGMPSALQSLALACAQYDPPNLGKFHFARCDLRALQSGYDPAVLDLYRTFDPAETARLAELHEFFTGLGYKTSLQVGVNNWVVKYQGNRKVKGSPLFQVEYQERFTNPLCVQIKCASANRITALVSRQSQALQDDFFTRSLRCRAEACNWCQSRKGMEPSTLVYGGQEYATCWYVLPDVRELTGESVALIKEYALMHEELLGLN